MSEGGAGEAGLSVASTAIPGLLVVTLPVHGDTRGWFKENWQRAKMTALGLPDFGPVQQNVSFNSRRGATRGVHAEPWDKLVSVASGGVFGAWVDLREGPGFGTTVTLELTPAQAVYVPRGVGNAYQTLDDATVYSYLVNDHWRPGIAYPAVALDDPDLAIAWPVPLADGEVSAKDRANPRLAEVTPVPPRRPLVLGGGGQLGRALAEGLPGALVLTRAELDVTDAAALEAWDWAAHDVVVNAAAYTSVDAAETLEGRAQAWAANAQAPAHLARLAVRHGFTLVHYSTDYVFDGTSEEYLEDAPFVPLSVYGQSKAAGELAVSVTPRHYLLRTSWVVGDGPNFVRTMRALAENDVAPAVVSDQVGRLTFTDELARATRHLLESRAPFGTYNVTNSGPPQAWSDVAAAVFELSGRSASDVAPITTEEYAAGRPTAPRPASSVLSLAKIESTGFTPTSQEEGLRAYLSRESSSSAES